MPPYRIYILLYCISDGAQSRNRTSDTRIFSPLLYRLSYQGMVGLARLELATSRLSGVRANHLSYRPLYGRGGGTRTPGPMVPNHVRYQTALHPDCYFYISTLAGIIGLEPTAHGFGDHCSTN